MFILFDTKNRIRLIVVGDKNKSLSTTYYENYYRPNNQMPFDFSQHINNNYINNLKNNGILLHSIGCVAYIFVIGWLFFWCGFVFHCVVFWPFIYRYERESGIFFYLFFFFVDLFTMVSVKCVQSLTIASITECGWYSIV